MMKHIAVLIVAVLLFASPALTQTHVFSPGSRLRIEAPSIFPGRLEGVVRDYTHEGVRFEASTSGRDYWVMPTELRYLAQYRGEDRRYVMVHRARTLGFVAGAVGAVSGPGIAVALQSSHLARGAAIGALSGAVLGSSAGLVWGSRHQGDVWREHRIIGIGRPRNGSH